MVRRTINRYKTTLPVFACERCPKIQIQQQLEVLGGGYNMIIEKKGKVYTVTESSTKWTVKSDSGKLLVAFDVSKELCATADELREYVLSNNELF